VADLALAVARWLSPRPQPPRTGLAYVAVRVVVYLVALVLIAAIYGTKARGLLIGPPIGLLAGAATWYLLGDTPVERDRRLILAAGVGLLLAELTWALGYWSVAPLMGGAALWLGFYVLSGLVEHAAAQTLERRVALEFATVAIVGCLVVVVLSRPWSP
jgi:hypothetical protein